jgi:hypothetical protein
MKGSTHSESTTPTAASGSDAEQKGFHETIDVGGTRRVSRKPGEFRFVDQVLPRLNERESAVSLLRSEESISPLHTAISLALLSYGANERRILHNPEQYGDDYDDMAKLRQAVNVPLLKRAQILQTSFAETFDTLAIDFRDIFPTVTEVRVGLVAEFRASAQPAIRDMVTLAIKEVGVPNWVLGPDLSSGMFRTFVHLMEFELSPNGTVYLIDEVENSLGLNCLGPVIDHVKQKSRDIQFILTSHHPYIINNIGIDDWRIVTRKGSTVTVKNAAEIPALNGQSRQDKFIRLINATEYEAGIQ